MAAYLEGHYFHQRFGGQSISASSQTVFAHGIKVCRRVFFHHYSGVDARFQIAGPDRSPNHFEIAVQSDNLFIVRKRINLLVAHRRLST